MLDFEIPQNFTLIRDWCESETEWSVSEIKKVKKAITFFTSVRRQGLEPWTH